MHVNTNYWGNAQQLGNLLVTIGCSLIALPLVYPQLPRVRTQAEIVPQVMTCSTKLAIVFILSWSHKA